MSDSTSMENEDKTVQVIDRKPYAGRVKEMADALGSYVRAMVGGADDVQRYQSFEDFFDELTSLIGEIADSKLTPDAVRHKLDAAQG